MQGHRYNLFTTVAMIVGIVIGSGIFFKTDNILVTTNGNVLLGILVFCIAAISIVFGSLTISSLAALTDAPGGIITYSEDFISKKFATAFGWFQTFIYYPTLTTVISWVVGIFFGILFDLKLSLMEQVAIGFAWFVICFVYNILSAKIGGYFQNFATIVKIIPLVVIGVTGFVFGNPVESIFNSLPNTESNLSWMSAIGPIAFSFDGWIISTAIAHEVKNSKKNLPRALVFSPLFILIGYLIYFIGISSYVGPEKVIELGDESVYFLATSLFGQLAAKALLIFIVISVMGTVNGVVLGFIRLPYSLAIRGMLPSSKWLSTINHKNNMPVNSGIFAFVICLFWWVIHYFSMKYNMLPNSDVSEISVTMQYLLYIALYFKVFMLWKQGRIKGVVKGVVCPILATIGSLFILFGGLQNPLFFIFVFICFISLAIGYFYKPSKG